MSHQKLYFHQIASSKIRFVIRIYRIQPTLLKQEICALFFAKIFAEIYAVQKILTLNPMHRIGRKYGFMVHRNSYGPPL